jgi:hypothetical protein
MRQAPKDDAQILTPFTKRHTRMPFGLGSADISAYAVRVYVVLTEHADIHGRAWPGRERIAAAMKVSTTTVDRAIRELVRVGLVVKTTRCRLPAPVARGHACTGLLYRRVLGSTVVSTDE